jgi:outer membrane protein assembly factor BamB
VRNSYKGARENGDAKACFGGGALPVTSCCAAVKAIRKGHFRSSLRRSKVNLPKFEKIQGALFFAVLLVLPACGHIPHPEPVRGTEPVLQRGWSYLEPEKSFLGLETGVDAISYSSPVLASERLIFGSERFGITALSRRNGQVLWQHKLDSAVMAVPLVLENFVVAGSGAGTVYKLELNGGHEVWHVNLGSAVNGAPIFAYQRLYVGTEDEAVHALDPATGKVLWSYRRPPFSGTSVRGGGNPAAVAGKIWLGFSDGFLVSLNPDSGAVESEKQYRDNLKFSDLDARVVGWRDGLLVSTYDGKLRYLRRDGSLVWEFKSGGSRPPLVDDGEVIYFPSSDGAVYAISGNTGKEIWSYALKRGIPAGIALVTRHQKKILVVAGTEEKVLALDAGSGKLLGQVSLGKSSGSYGNIAVNPDGSQFFVLSQMSRVHEFRLNL